jgi:hypothetical protein
MGTQIDYRTLETRITHDGHGDQELPIEIAVSRRIITDTGRLDIAEPSNLAARVAGSFALRVHPQSALKSWCILILGDRPVNQA